MRVVTVGYVTNGRFRSHGRPKGRACKLCLHVMREGQRALCADDYTYCHLSCLGNLLRDEAGFHDPTVVQAEFDALRQRLLVERANWPIDPRDREGGA